MYDRLYEYLCEGKFLYTKQFGFRKGHYKDHSIVQNLDQIYPSCGNDNCPLEAFRNSFKIFDTVDHSLLLKRLEMYFVNTTNRAWFSSYLYGRKQYLKITECADILKQDTKSGVPQGSILRPLCKLSS